MKGRRTSILLLIDPETARREDPQLRAHPVASSRMEMHVAAGLRSLGHRVEVLPCGPSADQLCAGLGRARPHTDLVFNLSEHFGGDRRGDALVVAALELFGLPYTGADAACLRLCRDKAESKRRLTAAGLAVPPHAVVEVGESRLPALSYPVLVKPLFGDASEGISTASLARTPEAALSRARQLHRITGQAAICESFVAGRELKVALLGDRTPQVLPPREVRFGSRGPSFLTSRVKDDAAYRRRWGIRYQRARLAPSALSAVERASRRAYRALGLRDYGKLDLRLGAGGEVVFLEANPNPDLSPRGLGTIASWAGIDYPRLLDTIVGASLARSGP